MVFGRYSDVAPLALGSGLYREARSKTLSSAPSQITLGQANTHTHTYSRKHPSTTKKAKRKKKEDLVTPAPPHPRRDSVVHQASRHLIADHHALYPGSPLHHIVISNALGQLAVDGQVPVGQSAGSIESLIAIAYRACTRRHCRCDC